MEEEEENGACIAEVDETDLPVILDDVDVMSTSMSPRRSVVSAVDIVFLQHILTIA